MRRLITGLVLAAVSVGASSTTVDAAGVTVGGYTDGSGGGVRIVAPGDAGRGGATGGSTDGGTRQCAYFQAMPADVPYVGEVIADPSLVEPGTPVVLRCRDTTTGEIVYSLLQQWDPGQPTMLVPSAATLAEIAASSITLPVPAAQTWPADGVGLVNLPVWLHVANWHPLNATASAGGLSATVDAHPVRALWDMGDGSITCLDGGTPYEPGIADLHSSTCAHTYRHSSGREPGGHFAGSVAVTWRLRWRATDGQTGDLGELTSPQTAFTIRVEESQALVGGGFG